MRKVETCVETVGLLTLNQWRISKGVGKAEPVTPPELSFSGVEKFCPDCSEIKPIELFELRSDTGNVRNTCKECRAKYVKNWKELHYEAPRLCPVCGETQTIKEKCFRCKQTDTMRQRYATDIEYKVKIIHRNRISAAIFSFKHDMPVVDYESFLGCSWTIFISWMEYLFDDGMTWNNYGEKWHIDHVLPLNNFNLLLERDRRISFHWTNMQPKFASDNMSKGSKIRIYEYFNILVSLHRFVDFYGLQSVYQNIGESLCWLREKTQVR